MRFRDLPNHIAADDGFPVTEATLVEEHGDVVIQTADGEQPLSTFFSTEEGNVFDNTEQMLRHLHTAHTPSLPLREVPSYASAFITFPMEQHRFLSLFGDINIEAPGEETGETVRKAIERCSDDPSHKFLDELDLANTLFCNVGDEYIGRKYYDDRGDNVGSEEDAVSF